MKPSSLAAVGCLASAFLFVSMSLEAAPQNDNHLPVQVRVEGGLLEGSYNTDTHVETYLGVPYAQPPVGALRWREPEPAQPWTGVRMAKAFGPRAVQPPVYSDMIFRSAGLSEDCLYLNIWNYTKNKAVRQPVLVYFFGGGFLAGDGSEIRYDGESLAKQGIVTVTVTYRLNLFGFLSLPELTAESGRHASGNYGLMDQVAALKWVKRNIAAFGGDPDQVTIGGESVGSMSVSMLMASPLAKGLFVRAIGESGAAIAPSDYAPVSQAEAEQAGLDFERQSGMRSLADLRAADTRQLYDLYEAAQRPHLPAAIDGYFLNAPLTATYAAGRQAHVPLLVGWNSQEMGAADLLGDAPATPDSFEKAVKKAFPGVADSLIAALPHATTAEALASATELASARFMGYPTWKWAKLHARTSGAPVYRYLYAHVRPPMMQKYGGPGPGGALEGGAVHSAEIEYFLGNVALSDEYAWTDDDRALSQTCTAYIANFVKTGNPNGPGLPDWPATRNEGSAPVVMRLDLASKAAPSTVEEHFKLLDPLYSSP